MCRKGLRTPLRDTTYGLMETEASEDKKLARPCDCGHPAALHELDGVGHCKVAGCDCLGLAVAADGVEGTDSEGDDADEAVR